MPIDPIFGTDTEISRGAPVANPAPSSNTANLRAETISRAAYRVRSALFASYERVQSSPADILPPDEQTDLLMAAFCDRPRQLSAYRSSELDEAISDFRALVPLVPFNAIDHLERAPIGVDVGDGRELLRLRGEGRMKDAELEERARELAKRARIAFPEELPIGAAIDTIERSISRLHKQGSVLKEYAVGSESRVFINEPGGVVYKALPFRGELLQIPPALHDGEFEARNDYGTFLADAYGGMPLFDRAKLLASVAGVCRTELVAVSASGHAIYKQPFLGEREPSSSAIGEWLEQFGHAGLPEQNSAVLVLADITKTPFVAEGLDRDQYVIGMDLNPRNARVWNGACVPFDPVLRELKAEEIASHPRLRAAVQEIEAKRARRKRLAISI